jgi:hypothetical protein
MLLYYSQSSGTGTRAEHIADAQFRAEPVMFSLRGLLVFVAISGAAFAIATAYDYGPVAATAGLVAMFIFAWIALSRRLGQRYRILLAGLALVLIFISLTAATLTRGGLGFVSLDTLERQTQSEWTLFSGGLVLYRSPLTTHPLPLLEYAKAKGFIKALPPQGRAPEILFHWNDAWPGSGHHHIYRIFCGGTQDVIDWCDANPNLAKLYWAEGFAYLRSKRRIDNYIGAEILRTGYECTTLAELQSRIDSIKQYHAFELHQQPTQYSAFVSAASKSVP